MHKQRLVGTMKRKIAVIVSLLAICSYTNLPAQGGEIKSKPVNDKVYLITLNPDDLVIGRRDAPVTIVSYTSLTCTHCAEFHNIIIPALNEDIESGRLKIILRHFPLDKISLYAAVLVEQTPKEERLARLHTLFEKQDKWLREADSPEVLAQMCGLTMEAFKACVESQDNQSPILKQWLDAKHQFDVEAAPSFIIQGKLYEGLLTLDEFKTLVKQG